MITLGALQHTSQHRIFYGEGGEHPRLFSSIKPDPPSSSSSSGN
ncbi:unnamed protein product, partial [Arabidopsis halleri]